MILNWFKYECYHFVANQCIQLLPGGTGGIDYWLACKLTFTDTRRRLSLCTQRDCFDYDYKERGRSNACCILYIAVLYAMPSSCSLPPPITYTGSIKYEWLVCRLRRGCTLHSVGSSFRLASMQNNISVGGGTAAWQK